MFRITSYEGDKGYYKLNNDLAKFRCLASIAAKSKALQQTQKHSLFNLLLDIRPKKTP
jgi:hypothetical protein